MDLKRFTAIFLCLGVLILCVAASGCFSQTNNDLPEYTPIPTVKPTLNTYAGGWTTAIDTTSYYITFKIDGISNTFSYTININDADKFNKIHEEYLGYLCNEGDAIQTVGTIKKIGENTYQWVMTSTTLYDKAHSVISEYLYSPEESESEEYRTTFVYDNISDKITMTDAYSTMKFKRIY